MFPLTQIYMADYKNKVWDFKRPDHRDLYAVSEWLAASLHGSDVWRRRMYKQLLQEFRITAAMPQQMSWIVTASNKRVCWFDIEEIFGDEVTIHLTAPPNLLRDDRAALILWRRTLIYLLSLDTWSHFRVYLDISRVAEARALEKLGFKRDGDWYVL